MPDYNFEHTGIIISNLERSISFYMNNFGFKETRKVDRPELELKLANIQLGDFVLELIELYESKEKTEKPSMREPIKKLIKNSPSHIAISTDKTHTTYSKLQENNIPLTPFDENLFFCCDPDNYLIEVKKRR